MSAHNAWIHRPAFARESTSEMGVAPSFAPTRPPWRRKTLLLLWAAATCGQPLRAPRSRTIFSLRPHALPWRPFKGVPLFGYTVNIRHAEGRWDSMRAE
jgi:hypothetical protein